MRARRYFGLLLGGCCLFLSACGGGVANKAPTAYGDAQPNALHVIWQRLFGQHKTLKQRLMEHGVQVVIVADNILITLPTDLFYYPNSPNRIIAKDALLNDVATLLRRVQKVAITVSAYTDRGDSPARAASLTRQQAQDVTHYLSQQGVDARFLVSEGFGQQAPIATNQTSRGRLLNRRIAISLRTLPSPRVL